MHVLLSNGKWSYFKTERNGKTWHLTIAINDSYSKIKIKMGNTKSSLKMTVLTLRYVRVVFVKLVNDNSIQHGFLNESLFEENYTKETL